MYSRRDFGKLTLASLSLSAAFAKPNSKIDGVQIGAQSYSFRDRPLDDAIKGFLDVGLSECELWQGHAEPQIRGSGAQQELRKWRTTVPLDHFKQIAGKFKKAGIKLYAYNYSFRDDFSDEEATRGFEFAKALGVKYITASSTVTMAKRIAPFADRYKIVVAMHGHSNLKDPNEFAKPESFEQAMSYSKNIWVNLDIGHFWAAGYDPVDYIEKHHARIATLHIKDRGKNQGENLPFGQGDTPIKQVLQLLKKKRYRIPANIEYEYKGADTVAEVKKCYAYCRQALTA